jgi:hypothetical protein
MHITLSVSEPQRRSQHIHRPLHERVLVAIEIALRRAWKELLNECTVRYALQNGNEKEITKLFRERLERIRVRARNRLGYNCSVFERPHVDAEYSNYTDAKAERPDLVFHLSGRPRPGVVDSLYDGLYVECKIIDNGSRSIGEYCRKGVKRFVDGDYGWRMPQGMMCAYVRTTQRLPIALEIHFVRSGVAAPLCLVSTSLSKSTLTRQKPPIYISVHARPWTFPDGSSPGNISVQHLWLEATHQSHTACVRGAKKVKT